MKNWATDFENSGYKTFSYTDEFIRIFNNIALVRSKTVYTKEADGKIIEGNSIYTDTCVKENGDGYVYRRKLHRLKNKLF